MAEVNAATPLIHERGTVMLLDAFERRRMLIAYYFMWHDEHPAAEQCEGCALYTAQVRELSFLHSRYSVQGTSLDALLEGRPKGTMYRVCYLRRGNRVFETYWTTRRGVEVMGNSYPLLDRTVYGRQESWEDSPTGWPQTWKDDEKHNPYRVEGRPIVQWPRVKEGHSDDLRTGRH